MFVETLMHKLCTNSTIYDRILVMWRHWKPKRRQVQPPVRHGARPAPHRSRTWLATEGSRFGTNRRDDEGLYPDPRSSMTFSFIIQAGRLAKEGFNPDL